MSPHALSVHEDDGSSYDDQQIEPPSLTADAVSNGHSSHSLLKSAGDDEIQDLVCVGFGPASLAIAIALSDALEEGQLHQHTTRPKVRFLERQPRFAWHAGMLLPGAKMQITFVKDLATLRNPRSEFTFLNYLHKKDRLVQFTNLGTFLPQRIEYENYMRWCADHFNDVVDYNRDVQCIEAGATCPKTGAIEHFRVTSRDSSTGQSTTLKARHVVIAAGGKPNIPKSLPANHPRIIHSSQYATSVSQMFEPGQQPRSVAVIGAGQSAAEVFNNIPSRFPTAKSYLLIRGSALHPSDDSPFVNEIFDPDRVDDIYSQAPAIRAQEIARDKATNYSVVRLELLEHIYSLLYSYRIQHDKEEDWPQRILPHRTVTGVEDCEVDGRAALKLHVQNDSNTFQQRQGPRTAELVVDLVVVASGYRRDAHEDMLRGLDALKPGGHERWSVRRDYGVRFADDSVRSDAGVWLQGCNEQTHGLSDSLLSILAMRGGEMVQSIFGQRGCGAVRG